MQTNAWAGAGSSPTPGSFVSRRVGSGKRRRFRGARAEAPEVRGGRGQLREPVPRVEAPPNGCGLVPDAGICSFSSPRSASELIKAAAARAKADPDAPEGLPVDMARKTHKGAKGVAGALARAQLATASLGNFDAIRRRSRRAPAAASSGPRTATRPRASRASCPGSTTSPTATSARCCGRAVTTATARGGDARTFCLWALFGAGDAPDGCRA